MHNIAPDACSLSAFITYKVWIDTFIYIVPISRKSHYRRFSRQRDVFSKIVWKNRKEVPAAAVQVEDRSTVDDRLPRNSYDDLSPQRQPI